MSPRAPPGALVLRSAAAGQARLGTLLAGNLMLPFLYCVALMAENFGNLVVCSLCCLCLIVKFPAGSQIVSHSRYQTYSMALRSESVFAKHFWQMTVLIAAQHVHATADVLSHSLIR